MNKRFLIVLTGFLMLFAETASADFAAGLAAAERGDYGAAYRAWLPLAEQGDAVAQYNLGIMYQNGQGVASDGAEAAKWFDRAAVLGIAGSRNELDRDYRSPPPTAPQNDDWMRSVTGRYVFPPEGQ